jgi:hypothetical protein
VLNRKLNLVSTLFVLVSSQISYGNELHDAIISQDIGKVKELLEARRSDADFLNDIYEAPTQELDSELKLNHYQGYTPLHCAIQLRNSAIIAMLLSNDAVLTTKEIVSSNRNLSDCTINLNKSHYKLKKKSQASCHIGSDAFSFALDNYVGVGCAELSLLVQSGKVDLSEKHEIRKNLFDIAVAHADFDFALSLIRMDMDLIKIFINKENELNIPSDVVSNPFENTNNSQKTKKFSELLTSTYEVIQAPFAKKLSEEIKNEDIEYEKSYLRGNSEGIHEFLEFLKNKSIKLESSSSLPITIATATNNNNNTSSSPTSSFSGSSSSESIFDSSKSSNRKSRSSKDKLFKFFTTSSESKINKSKPELNASSNSFITLDIKNWSELVKHKEYSAEVVVNSIVATLIHSIEKSDLKFKLSHLYLYQELRKREGVEFSKNQVLKFFFLWQVNSQILNLCAQEKDESNQKRLVSYAQVIQKFFNGISPDKSLKMEPYLKIENDFFTYTSESGAAAKLQLNHLINLLILEKF